MSLVRDVSRTLRPRFETYPKVEKNGYNGCGPGV
jgi:hypothetical protein